MDGLSAAASVIAVAQIAIQLGQGIAKIRSLLQSISDAPGEIQMVVQELEFFDSIINQIRRNGEIFGSQADICTALARCDASLKALLDIAESLLPGLASDGRVRRKWAAIEVVRKNDKITKFKMKLQEAKLDLLIAQQTSAAHAQYLGHKSNYESLMTLNERLATLTEKLSYSSIIVPSSIGQQPIISGNIPSMTLQADSLLGSQAVPSGLESKLTQVVRDTITNALESNNQDDMLLPCATANARGNRVPGRRAESRRFIKNSIRVTRTVLGEMRCSVTTYQIGQALRNHEFEEFESEGQQEVETSFHLVPSWWVMKFGFARVLKFDVMEFNTQIWQARMSSFNVVPSDSPIFNFCQEGNLEAVQSLLRHGKASVRDITTDGLTPLHAAASRCDPAICALLLQEGADPTLREHSPFKLTPFEFAWFPGNMSYNRQALYPIRNLPGQKLDQTIRTFLRLDHDFDEAIHLDIIRNMICHEGDGWFKDLGEKTPSMWFIFELMPIINPTIIDEQFWQTCLDATLRSKWNHSTTEKIMSHCTEDMIRSAFMEWIWNMRIMNSKEKKWSVRDFNLLRERSGGLHFLHKHPRRDQLTSLIFFAMETSWTFTILRDVLDRAGIDRQQFIKDQLSSFNDGWNHERLSKVFDQPPQPTRLTAAFMCECCQVCPVVLHDVIRDEVPWAIRLSRLKADIDLTSPLDEEEARNRKEWDQILDLGEICLCSECFLKGLKPRESSWQKPIIQDYRRYWKQVDEASGNDSRMKESP